MTVTATSLIYRALRLLTVLRAGQVASTEMLADGLADLNDMVDAWAADRLLVQSIRRDVVDVVAGTADYTLGTGGGWNIPRPSRIDKAAWLDAGFTDQAHEHEIRVTEDPSSYGDRLYIDRAYPLRHANILPVPAGAYTQLALYTWQPLAQFGDLTTQYDLPPAFALALRYSLAVVMLPGAIAHAKLPAPVRDSIESQAREYKAAIESLNSPLPEVACDPAMLGTGQFDILTGDYRW